MRHSTDGHTSVQSREGPALPTWQTRKFRGDGHRERFVVSSNRKSFSHRNAFSAFQGSLDVYLPDQSIHVSNFSSASPNITVETVSQADPYRQIVAEAMILCGEAVASFASARNLPLPFRGQGPPKFYDPEGGKTGGHPSRGGMTVQELLSIPEGLSRSAHLRGLLSKGEVNCTAAIPHSGLGLQGYVQFTSPIRRYGDMLAHYQVRGIVHCPSECVALCNARLKASPGLSSVHW